MESVRDPNVDPPTTARCGKHHPTSVQPVVVVIWMCVYDRKVYIFKKGIDIFSKKGFLRGDNVAKGGGTKNVCSPLHKCSCSPLSALLSHTCGWSLNHTYGVRLQLRDTINWCFWSRTPTSTTAIYMSWFTLTMVQIYNMKCRTTII